VTDARPISEVWGFDAAAAGEALAALALLALDGLDGRSPGSSPRALGPKHEEMLRRLLCLRAQIATPEARRRMLAHFATRTLALEKGPTSPLLDAASHLLTVPPARADDAPAAARWVPLGLWELAAATAIADRHVREQVADRFSRHVRATFLTGGATVPAVLLSTAVLWLLAGLALSVNARSLSGSLGEPAIVGLKGALAQVLPRLSASLSFWDMLVICEVALIADVPADDAVVLPAVRRLPLLSAPRYGGLAADGNKDAAETAHDGLVSPPWLRPYLAHPWSRTSLPWGRPDVRS
jgi:hypothetical protein